jgi:hypothetical protein
MSSLSVGTELLKYGLDPELQHIEARGSHYLLDQTPHLAPVKRRIPGPLGKPKLGAVLVPEDDKPYAR